MVIEDLSDRVEKMEDRLHQIERNQLTIMDKLALLEGARGTALQPHHNYTYMHHQANFHSPVIQGPSYVYNQQNFIPPVDQGQGYNHGYNQQNFVSPPPSTADQAVLQSVAPQPYHTTPHRLVQEAPRSISIKTKNPEKALPSSEINTTSLVSIDMVVAKYSKLKGEAKAPTLAMKLAKEVIFGEEVMKKCTLVGGRDLLGLPVAELQIYLSKPCSTSSPNIGRIHMNLKGSGVIVWTL